VITSASCLSSFDVKQAAVREYAHHLVGYGIALLPSQDELQVFENGKGIGPTAQSFRLDLASAGLASKWNARAAEIFAEAFLQEEELMTEFSDRDAIIRAFITHITTLQKHYTQPIRRAKMTEAERNGQRDKEKLKARDQRKRGVCPSSSVTNSYRRVMILYSLVYLGYSVICQIYWDSVDQMQLLHATDTTKKSRVYENYGQCE
jgi:hypothetical protein